MGLDTKFREECGGGQTERVGDMYTVYFISGRGETVIPEHVDGGLGRGGVLAEMADSSLQGADGTDVLIAGRAHGDTLASDPVLLIIVAKRRGPSGSQGLQWYDGARVPSLLDEELYITESKGFRE